MENKNIFINASNIHSGGGKTLLNGLLQALKTRKESIYLFVDPRYHINFDLPESLVIIKINKFLRFSVASRIKQISNKKSDQIIYFGNLPPIKKFKSLHVSLLLSSRFYVDSISMKGFKITDSIKIYFEKLYFKFFIKNVSHIIVQTSSMSKKLTEFGFKKKISVLPFDDLGPVELKKISNKEPSSFIYVASLIPYKNHKRLLKAWNLLKDLGLNPKLYLTVDNDCDLKKWIKFFIKQNNLNIELLENLSRKELIERYIKTEVLIYPSLFEAYGLPLIEAKKYQMKIISSDLDYCWDFLSPDEFFNPEDVHSIVRAVKRYLKVKPNLDKIYNSKEFLNKVIKP